MSAAPAQVLQCMHGHSLALRHPMLLQLRLRPRLQQQQLRHSLGLHQPMLPQLLLRPRLLQLPRCLR